MARPDLEDEFDRDEFVHEFGADEPSQPWHNSTRAVIGASAAGLAVIGVLVAAIMFVTRQDDTPSAPTEFVDPSFSSPASDGSGSLTSSTTTATITSTTPPSTTEINGPTGPSTTSDTSGSSTTSGTTGDESRPPATIRTREPEDNTGGPTSRRPRFNITRTLAPQQAG